MVGGALPSGLSVASGSKNHAGYEARFTLLEHVWCLYSILNTMYALMAEYEDEYMSRTMYAHNMCDCMTRTHTEEEGADDDVDVPNYVRAQYGD